MSVIEDIKNYSEKMDVNFYTKHWVKVCSLEREISRHLQKHMRDRSYNLTFTSQDLRTLTIKMEKVLRTLNKRSEYMSINKKFSKYDTIPTEFMTEVLTTNIKELALGRNLHMSVGFMNRYCAILAVLENGIEYAKKVRKEEDDEILRHIIYEALVEVA